MSEAFVHSTTDDAVRPEQHHDSTVSNTLEERTSQFKVTEVDASDLDVSNADTTETYMADSSASHTSSTSTSHTIQSGLGDIVVGVDGSEGSFAALQWALREASLTGQSVNAVFAWTHSWDMGGNQPDTPEEWAKVREQITAQLLQWVEEASRGMSFDPANLKLTSVRASGTTGLLQIGSNAQQIVVGRRSLGRVLRWFLGSLSASLAEAANVPVTVVRIPGTEDESVQDAIANSLAPGAVAQRPRRSDFNNANTAGGTKRPVVVGVDGSDTSRHALQFAIDLAKLHRVPLHVMFCWQLRDLGTVPGYENSIAPIEAGQQHAEQIVQDMIDQADIPDNLEVQGNAFHIVAAKGLTSASRYAGHLVVGSRGLSGLDAHFLGSVSRQILNFAECNVTIVH